MLFRLEDLLLRLVAADRTSSPHFFPMTHDSLVMKHVKATGGNANPDLSGILPPGHKESHYWAIDGRKMGAFLDLVWQADDLDALSECMMREPNSMKRCLLALKIRYVDANDDQHHDEQEYDTPDPRACSLEFRYPEMSFDPVFIQMWAKLATRIVHVAHQSQDGAYQRALRDIIQVLDRAQTVDSVAPDLLQALGVDDDEVHDWIEITKAHDNGEDPSLLPGRQWRMLRSLP